MSSKEGHCNPACTGLKWNTLAQGHETRGPTMPKRTDFPGVGGSCVPMAVALTLCLTSGSVRQRGQHAQATKPLSADAPGGDAGIV